MAVLGCSADAVASNTIWASTSIPTVADVGADSAVELGVSFKSDVNGYITGIRFYKSDANTGTHVGNLWSSTGTLLASATFTSETASGWQQVNFANPVAITANTVYVAFYHSTIGHGSTDWNFFASSGVDNPPLHALANVSGTPDGRYSYGSGSVFPTSSNNANYWVDVAFAPATTTSASGNGSTIWPNTASWIQVRRPEWPHFVSNLQLLLSSRRSRLTSFNSSSFNHSRKMSGRCGLKSTCSFRR